VIVHGVTGSIGAEFIEHQALIHTTLSLVDHDAVGVSAKYLPPPVYLCVCMLMLYSASINTCYHHCDCGWFRNAFPILYGVTVAPP